MEMEKLRVYGICLGIFPLMVGSGMIYSILALYISELGASIMHVGIIFTVGAFSGAVSSPLIGKLSDKIGRRKILLASMVMFTFVFIFYAFAESFIDLYYIQVVEGLAWASLTVSAVTLISDITPKDRRGSAIGIYDATWYLGWIIGPSLGGFLAETYGFRQTFIVCSILMVIGVFLAYLTTKNLR